MKKLLLILIFLGSLILGVGTAFASASTIADLAGVLKPNEIQQLQQTIQSVEQKYNVRLGIVITESTGGIGKYANAVLDRDYNNGNQGNIVLVQDITAREWYIATDNKMRAIITDEVGISYISGEFLPFLQENDYFGAYNSFVHTVDEMLSYYQEKGKPFDPQEQFNMLAFFIAVILALVAGYAVRFCLVASMSNVTSATGADAYLNKQSFNLTDSKDMFLYMNIVRVPKSKDNVTNDSSDRSHGGGGGKY